MKAENEEQQKCSMAQSKSDNDTTAFHKESKISYTRSFLLSLSELDTCKMLPMGFDKSVLGEVNDSWTGLLQPCPNSDSGRYQDNKPRRACQKLELGVLGPGAFPRPSCVSGPSAPVAQGSCYHLLNRSTTAYQSPHLNKAKHQSRRDQDSYNDETFGGSDHPSQGREDEERRRRVSFELMRKEQEKAFQKKEKKIPDEHKENLQPDIATTLEASQSDKGLVKTYNESEKPVAVDFAGQYVTTQSEILLPLALKRSHEKNLGRKSLICTSISEPIEQSIISELSEHCSTQCQSGKGWSTFERKSRVPNFADEHVAFQDLTLIQKQQEADPTESSKLNISFSDKFSVSETGDNGFGKNLQTTEFSGIQREPRRFPFLTSDNNYMIPSTFNESGPIKMHRKEIIPSGSAKKTAVSKIEESLPMSDDIWMKPGLEPKFSLVSACNETADLMDDIHLPEEDSLITVDDCILPLSDVVTTRRPVKADFFSPSSQVNIADKLAALDRSFSDKRSPQLGLEGPIFDSYDINGLDTYRNLHKQQFNPQMSRYQTNPGRAFFNSSYAQDVHMSSDKRFLDQETYHFNPQPFHPFPTNMFADPFQHPHAELTMFDRHINAPPRHQMHIPSKFSSPHQVSGLPRGLPSYHPIDEMTCYAPELHPAQNFPLYLLPQYHRGFAMPISDQIAAGNNCQAARNRLFEMEVRDKRMHYQAAACRGSNFGRQDDFGSWYGR